jgi:outer membrane receptor protein involved in Fe transport
MRSGAVKLADCRKRSAGRGVVNGPSLKRWDFSLFKNFRLGETAQLQFRCEAFNIFNQTNFTTLSLRLGASTFGQATAAADPRTIQLGVKMYF